MVVKMQPSLMHDVFYTKAEMIHSNLYGLCIHILPAVATTIAFLVFHILVTSNGHIHKDKGYNRLDVASHMCFQLGLSSLRLHRCLDPCSRDGHALSW